MMSAYSEPASKVSAASAPANAHPSPRERFSHLRQPHAVSVKLRSRSIGNSTRATRGGPAYGATSERTQFCAEEEVSHSDRGSC